MKMPRRRLDGCACTSPLAHFYIYHAGSSIRELHPFTTITHLASENVKTPKDEDDLTIQFLFRKRSNSLQPSESAPTPKRGFAEMARTLLSPKIKRKVQWTEKLASHADAQVSAAIPILSTSTNPKRASTFTFGPDHPHTVATIPLRLEGPYFTHADLSRYRTVICLVAGTGISGAIAIAGAFAETERQRTTTMDSCGSLEGAGACMASTANGIWERCVVVWSVREEDYIDMPFLKGIEHRCIQRLLL